ncbi:gliding motility protein RemB [Pedobacter chinensis]|uniref:Gliding motility protein RemB n=1 Tax=Pedobacter chinensis TaxID=2282421 RepID=A0A369PXA6_9SPHI|nr:gliding motility protein RemB [Pedobacter chinensis]RDC55835.1 gliding motility protein RemB [Pedobacter chinensis]
MKKLLYLSVLLIISIQQATAQATYFPNSHQASQKLNTVLYDTKTRLHSAVKPMLINDSLLKLKIDTLLGHSTPNDGSRSWIYRKIFTEHLIQIDQPAYSVYADYLPDHAIGRDFSTNKNVWINSRGFQVGVSIGNTFSFYTSGYENQAILPSYLDTYTNQLGIVSGQAYDHSNGANIKDWSYVTALMSYTPSKYLNITLGQDKTFIGDGYRSMFLSDFSAPFPFIKLNANLGNVSYMTMWSYMDDPSAPIFDGYGSQRKKWGVFQYLDWNVNNRLSVGLFQSVIWADADDQGHKRGFDLKYINPVIFLRNVQAAGGSPDNSLLGFNAKYEITDRLAVYGQLALDEFQAKDFFSSNGSSRNKYSHQLGIRGSELFGIKKLNYLLEYNAAKPYTYSHLSSINNYAQQNEPLAHPFGANFRELVGMLNFTIGRFDLSAETSYSKYGLDMDGNNFGKDLFQTYQTAPKYYSQNYTGQGLATTMYFAETKVAYLLNPSYNLRLELGGLFRHETNNLFTERNSAISIGLKSSFRNLYNDISSYRAH